MKDKSVGGAGQQADAKDIGARRGAVTIACSFIKKERSDVGE